MAPAGYTAREAATLIGRSERLIRAMAASGRLEIVSTDPLRVSAASVQRERRERRKKASKASASSPVPVTSAAQVLDAETLQAIIEAAIRAATDQATRMIEAREAVSNRHLIEELAASKAESDRLRQEREQLRTERTDRRRWWK